MKQDSKRIWIIAILLGIIVLGAVVYLFLIDRNNPRVYHPQVDYRFLQEKIPQLPSLTEDLSGEATVSQNGFKGILVYHASKSSVSEIKEHFTHLSKNPYDGTHITFPNDEYEIFVGDARYTPNIQAWGYGWLHYKGNIYAQQNGKDAAEAKPNFHNCFDFTIRKADEAFSFTVYCNKHSAEAALSAAIDYIRTLTP